MNKTSRKETMIKDTAKYSVVQYATQAIGFVTAFFMRKFLGPYHMGIWSLLKVVLSYFSYMGLGVDTATVYKIPFYRGKGDKQAEELVKNTAFSFLFLVSLISSALLVMAAIILRHSYPIEVIIGLIALAVYIILLRVYTFYIVVLRANKIFSALTKSMLFDAVVNLVLVFLIVQHFKLYGVYITISFLAVLNTLFVHSLVKYKIRFNINRKWLKELIRYGFPLLITGFLGQILRTLDTIMIAKMLSVTFVGYYSIGLMAKSYLYGLSNNLGIVTIPHMQEIYGKNQNPDDIKKFVTYSAEAISYIIAPFLGLFYISAPLFVIKFLPQYVPGILAFQILLLDTYFRSCSTQAQQFIVSIGKQARIIPVSIVAIILNIALNYTFIKIGWGIYGVALGTSLVSFFSFIVLLVFAMAHFASIKEIVLFLLRIIFPLCYIAIVLLLSKNITVFNLWITASLQVIILFIASVPLLYFMNKRTGVVSLIFSSIKNRFTNNEK